MHRINLAAFTALFACVLALPAEMSAQGKGKGSEKEKSGAQRAEGRAQQKASRGDDKRDDKVNPARATSGNRSAGQRAVERRSDRANAVAAGPNPVAGKSVAKRTKVEFLNARDVKRYKRELRNDDIRPEFRRLTVSNRTSELLAGGALAYAMARGISPSAFLFTPGTDLVELKNRKGNVLFALRDDDARALGSWRVAPLNDNTAEGAPSFCRSGTGHPVWGRQWCIDKGFGLGAAGNTRWGRTHDASDIRWNGDLGTGSLTRDALLALLGPTTFNRLALHAVTLGLVDPIGGQWRTDASGQRVLLVSSATEPVAEIADFNNDRRADLMLVALRGW